MRVGLNDLCSLMIRCENFHLLMFIENQRISALKFGLNNLLGLKISFQIGSGSKLWPKCKSQTYGTCFKVVSMLA